MKKFIFPTLLIGTSAIIFGFISLFKFAGYGGNNCDVDGKSCDCFCCHMFGLRGYESCGDFGLLVGLLVGGLFGFVTYTFIKKNKQTNNSTKI